MPDFKSLWRINLRCGWTLLPLRLLIGTGSLLHGLAKWNRGPAKFGLLQQHTGVPFPFQTAWLVTCLEVRSFGVVGDANNPVIVIAGGKPGKWKLYNFLIILASCALGLGLGALPIMWGMNAAISGHLAASFLLIFGAAGA
jgi:hypothetical protein